MPTNDDTDCDFDLASYCRVVEAVADALAKQHPQSVGLLFHCGLDGLRDIEDALGDRHPEFRDAMLHFHPLGEADPTLKAAFDAWEAGIE